MMTESTDRRHVPRTRLIELSRKMTEDSYHLKHLLEEENRLQDYSLAMDGFLYDFSKQRLTRDIRKELTALASQMKVTDTFSKMTSGDIVNPTEKRAALHTAAREFTQKEIRVNGRDILADINTVKERIKTFSEKVRGQTITGSAGKPFTDAVVVGIGGSYLGCDFAYTALKQSVDSLIKLHFLPNVDIDNFGEVVKAVPPDTCLWIVISKSYTTTETLANLNQVLAFLKANRLDPSKHIATVTAKGSPGDDPSNPVLDSFHMFDFIGGRYSVTSAVGGLPLSLAFGYDVFERFLKGCHAMDQHALNAPVESNIPLTAALISVWNSNFLLYPAQAIIPYCSALSKLAPHIQQVNMESLGKSASTDGEKIHYPTGVILFGEPGTNAQHSFFQLAHQGRPFPIDFIGVVKPAYDGTQVLSKGVWNHQELWANMIAQAQALAIGKTSEDAARHFDGNRPSSTIIINDLSPESIGRLLAFYEARTVFEGFLLGINPFDQFGVELGKKLASDIRTHIARKNTDSSYAFDTMAPAVRFYLDMLFRESL